MFTFDFASLQRLAVSAIGALVVSTVLLAATVGPVEAAVLVLPVL